jgi:hypothetical protein
MNNTSTNWNRNTASLINNLAPGTLLLAMLIILTVILGKEKLACLYAGSVLLIALNLLWRPGESQILLFIVLFQWTQASVKIFMVAFSQRNFMYFSEWGGDIERAAYFSLTGILFLTLGMRIGVGRWFPALAAAAQEKALSVSINKWFNWYVLSFVVARVAMYATNVVPGLGQPLLALASLKWAFFFMLTYASFLRPFSQRSYWIGVFIFEFLFGFGFFSDFKNVLFISFLGVMAAGVRFSLPKIMMATVLSMLTLVVAIYWTAVKQDFRGYISGGGMAQIETVSYSEQLSKLGSLIAAQNGRTLELAFDDLLSRLSYIDFFAAVLDTVPSTIAHTNGEIWIDAVERPFMPRILFPNKTIVDDSQRTFDYTGIYIIGAGTATSVSIGYIGESYIDFGPTGMMGVLFLYGWLLGRIYRWLAIRDISRGLLGMSMATAVLISASFLESSITKVFGGIIAGVLVVWLMNRLVIPAYLPWCLVRNRPVRVPGHRAAVDSGTNQATSAN